MPLLVNVGLTPKLNIFLRKKEAFSSKLKMTTGPTTWADTLALSSIEIICLFSM